MTRTDPRHDTDEPHTTDRRSAIFTTEDGIVIYDPENPTAWLESDATIDLEEVA